MRSCLKDEGWCDAGNQSVKLACADLFAEGIQGEWGGTGGRLCDGAGGQGLLPAITGSDFILTLAGCAAGTESIASFCSSHVGLFSQRFLGYIKAEVKIHLITSWGDLLGISLPVPSKPLRPQASCCPTVLIKPGGSQQDWL